MSVKITTEVPRYISFQILERVVGRKKKSKAILSIKYHDFGRLSQLKNTGRGQCGKKVSKD